MPRCGTVKTQPRSRRYATACLAVTLATPYWCMSDFSLGIGRTAVGEYIRRAAVIGITWPVAVELDDAALERKLFAPAGYNPPPSKPLPDWGHIHAELRRRGVTLALLWQDYRGQHPDGYGYSRFCDLYGEWRRGVTSTMLSPATSSARAFQ